jgi:copper oxidase (laccase) domain-containing protein
VYILDPTQNAIGIIHCGWRPITANILENTLAKMQSEFGSNLDDLIVYIGSCIKKDDYEVGNKLIKFFDASSFQNNNALLFFDMQNEIMIRLIKLGLRYQHINSFSISTFSDEAFCLFRRDKEQSGRLMAFLRIL